MPAADDPWDAWRKRYFRESGIPPEFFSEFEREFQRMQGMINKIMEDAMRHATGPRRSDPFVYGFSMRINKDGTPNLQPFGSAMAAAPDVPTLGEDGAPTAMSREPLTDIVEGDREIAVTVELPGVEKQDVNLHVAEEVVTVRVDKGRRYHKQIQLPAKVVPSSAKATFKNGILDVTLQRAGERGDLGQRVSID